MKEWKKCRSALIDKNARFVDIRPSPSPDHPSTGFPIINRLPAPGGPRGGCTTASACSNRGSRAWRLSGDSLIAQTLGLSGIDRWDLGGKSLRLVFGRDTRNGVDLGFNRSRRGGVGDSAGLVHSCRGVVGFCVGGAGRVDAGDFRGQGHWIGDCAG